MGPKIDHGAREAQTNKLRPYDVRVDSGCVFYPK